jgi:hypothetical protein
MNIKDILSKIHEDIKEQRVKLISLTDSVEELQKEIKLWELWEMSDISNRVNSDGKPLYSNDTKRQAELENRKDRDLEYQDMKVELKAAKLECDMAVIMLQCLIDKQENARALARIEGVA